jgi:hypothetical protein
MSAIVQGRLAFTGACLTLGGVPVVWPEGTSWDEQAQILTLPSGDQVGPRTRLTGGGGYYDLDGLAGVFGEPVAEAAEPCLGETGEIAVFNPGTPVTISE